MNLFHTHKIILLPVDMTESDQAMPFEEIFAIDDMRAAQVAFDMAITYEQAVEEDGYFNLEKAVKITEETPDYTLVDTLNTTVKDSNGKVNYMVDKVTTVLEDFLDIAMPLKQVEQIRAAITYAFTNLDNQTTDGWIFYQKKSAHSTVYQYNIMFAIQNASTGDIVFGVPLGMKITVDKEYERVLFITIKDSASYRVKLEAVKVAASMNAYENAHTLATLYSNFLKYDRFLISDIKGSAQISKKHPLVISGEIGSLIYDIRDTHIFIKKASSHTYNGGPNYENLYKISMNIAGEKEYITRMKYIGYAEYFKTYIFSKRRK